jgi:hypothetical protein
VPLHAARPSCFFSLCVVNAEEEEHCLFEWLAPGDDHEQQAPCVVDAGAREGDPARFLHRAAMCERLRDEAVFVARWVSEPLGPVRGPLRKSAPQASSASSTGTRRGATASRGKSAGVNNKKAITTRLDE